MPLHAITKKLSPAQRHLLMAMREHSGHIRAIFGPDGLCQGGRAVTDHTPPETIAAPMIDALRRDGWLIEEPETYGPNELPPFGTKLVLSDKAQLV